MFSIKQRYADPRNKYIVIPAKCFKASFCVNLAAAVKKLKEIILAIFFYRLVFLIIVIKNTPTAYMHKLNIIAQAYLSQNYRDKTICQQGCVLFQLTVIHVAPAGNTDAINDYFRIVFLNQLFGIAKTIYY